MQRLQAILEEIMPGHVSRIVVDEPTDRSVPYASYRLASSSEFSTLRSSKIESVIAEVTIFVADTSDQKKTLLLATRDKIVKRLLRDLHPSACQVAEDYDQQGKRPFARILVTFKGTL